MKKSRYSRKGFTLAEGMMAVFLLAIATSAVAMPFVAGANVRAEGARRTLAAKLAHDRLEQIVNTDYDQIFWTYEAYPWELFPGCLEDGAGGFLTDPIYLRFLRVSNVTPATVGGVELSWVTVRVYYDENEMIRLSTLVGR